MVSAPAAVYGTSAALMIVVVALAAQLSRLTPPPALATERRARCWSVLLAGVKFVWNRPILLGAISLDLFAVLLGGATALAAGLCAGHSRPSVPGVLVCCAVRPAVGAMICGLWLAQ